MLIGKTSFYKFSNFFRKPVEEKVSCVKTITLANPCDEQKTFLEKVASEVNVDLEDNNEEDLLYLLENTDAQ